LRENTYFEPLTTFLLPTVRPVQVSKNKKLQRKIDPRGDNFTTTVTSCHLSPEILTLRV